MTEARIAIVTGAANGIGWATAQLFAERGFRVVIADIDGKAASDKAAGLGARHLGQACNVTNESDVKDLMAAVGHCDVLVNNAGIGDIGKPTFDQDADHFRRVLDTHLTGTFLCSREAGRLMAASQGGAIVNISSIAAFGGLPGRNAYGAAKAGISMMTKNLACEWARHGIRVNAVAPGYAATELVRRLEASGTLDIAAIRRRTPMGRLVEMRELAEAIFFLASPAASAITGATLSVDCGWTAFGAAGDAS